MQSKLCLGQVDAGHGMTPFMTYTGQRRNGGNMQGMPVINSGTSYKFGKVGAGATINIGSSFNCNNSSVSNTASATNPIQPKRNGPKVAINQQTVESFIDLCESDDEFAEEFVYVNEQRNFDESVYLYIG